MAIYRKNKFTSPKKVGWPEIRAAHKSQKVGGLWPARPGSAANAPNVLKNLQFSLTLAISKLNDYSVTNTFIYTAVINLK